ncbi:MAG TPA: FAD-binding and (Fe-S)-binding domain-containing protein [Solirubrobacteraceae bacterium]|jgi:D-lactate dehydrogenase|nr:FAD-binding and (Fe-S)-binding domain-containing protein [Solirubrobacteraceae bacterium]
MTVADPATVVPEPVGPAPDRAPDWVAAGTPEPLRSRLVTALGADRVLTRALDLIRYAGDGSPYRLIPQAVVVPQDVEDVVALLRCAADTGFSVTFRAGGTSLNGQTQTDSVLVDTRRHWRRVRVEDDGARVRVQPGVVLGHANRLLARRSRRLGPDPASTNIACVGGVIANNSGGMRCGVVADSYRTVSAMTLVLANGAIIDTAAPEAEERFAAAAPELAAGLQRMRDEIRGDVALAERIARKFEIKNTTGYRLCAFLDADRPLEIFRRLVVGSEGTLAFVAEAVFETVPLGRYSTLALVGFEDLDAAAAAVGDLVGAGATATELMVAPTLIAAGYSMPGTPEEWKELPPTSAALLIEFRAETSEELGPLEEAALSVLDGRPLISGARFTRDAEETEMLWRVREGMQGLLAAVRPPGVTMMIEDVCVPPARVAEAAKDLQALLTQHGFLPGLAGHASAGNLHFILTAEFGKEGELERYNAFLQEMVKLIVDDYDGSLKAEHGTGINMAPFVEREWGPRATELMWEIKRLADPAGVLAPGIVLNRDPDVHLRNLKSVPEVEASVTKCIECGFCEAVCPSENVTTTPRQRIVLRREMARQAPGSPVHRALADQYDYDGVQTCAADGSCMRACPVAIDTGALIKDLRTRGHGPRAERAALEVARRYAAVERAARMAVRAGRRLARVAGDRRVAVLPAVLRERFGLADVLPEWSPAMPEPAPARLPRTDRAGAAAVYLPSCTNRIFGRAAGRGGDGRLTVPEALVAVSARAGLPLWIPDDVAGHCCATPWSSKGYAAGFEEMAGRTAAALRRWSEGGRLPVVIDASSCTYGARENLDLEGMDVIDSVAWVHDQLLERLPISRKLESMLVHPTCAAGHLGVSSRLSAIASHLADEAVVPAATRCCGMAGDRGWLHPELPAAALQETADELDGRSFGACVSSNRTCELALQQVTGRPYESFVLTLEELTRGDR